MSKLESIPFITDDNKEIRFCVLEQTMINGVNYLLVSDSQDDMADDAEDMVVYIMKETADEEGGLAAYEFVEDDEELLSVSKIFEQLMEDLDFEVE